jgi:hypothetical protein
MIYAFPVAVIAAALTGYIVGKFQERVAWNQLIEKGILPAPKQKKN